MRLHFDSNKLTYNVTSTTHSAGAKACKHFVENFSPWSNTDVFNRHCSSFIICSFFFSPLLNYFLVQKAIFPNEETKKTWLARLLIMQKWKLCELAQGEKGANFAPAAKFFHLIGLKGEWRVPWVERMTPVIRQNHVGFGSQLARTDFWVF